MMSLMLLLLLLLLSLVLPPLSSPNYEPSAPQPDQMSGHQRLLRDSGKECSQASRKS
jgi:hypothetical protein